MGLAAPELDVEIVDPETTQVVGIAEALWERGLQVGQGSPVVLELDGEREALATMQAMGYQVFTSCESLLDFARQRAREAAGTDPVDEVGGSHDDGGATTTSMHSDPPWLVLDDAGAEEPEDLGLRFGIAMRDV